MKFKKKKKSEYSIWKFVITLIVIGLAYFTINLLSNFAYEQLRTTEATTTNLSTTDQQAIILATRQKITEANIFIQVNFSSGYEIGSGVIVHEDEDFYYAITNQHILDGNSEVINSKSVRTSDSVESDFEIVAMDEIKDLALIKLSKESREEISPINTIDNVINIDDIVIAVGNPSGNIATITYGSIIRITSIQELEISRLVIEHDALLSNGSSGGALVDMYGNLVGINSWELNGLFYAIPITVINTFLQNNL